ncbi:HAD family hydrolase [Brachymonas denitrificans]|uniref:HAD family hydrolase n=1 Tax=Brachymonas denitrificans TaxID=28220 RepID=UPI002021CC82|nr:HAD family phosphatase [Brachymonas denitrificans]
MNPPRIRFAAVLFDCDGVLVDSEPLTMGVLRDMLEERGWRMTLQECMQLFVGKATKDEAARIERETGQPFTTEWLHSFWARRDVALRAHLQAIPGAAELVRQAHALTGGQIACVSGADRDKIGLQLSHTGLLPWFDGRIFSGHDMPRSKPHPDVYLAAMDRLQVAPDQCLVIEDTVTGVRAGVAAGATVCGLCLPGNPVVSPEQLLSAGAQQVVAKLDDVALHWR